MAMCIEIDPIDNIYIGGLFISNITTHDYDIFLMKNPKPTTKEAIAGYGLFIICILISSIVMIIVVKEGLKKKRSHHF